jgi:hypothetical protein
MGRREPEPERADPSARPPAGRTRPPGELVWGLRLMLLAVVLELSWFVFMMSGYFQVAGSLAGDRESGRSLAGPAARVAVAAFLLALLVNGLAERGREWARLVCVIGARVGIVGSCFAIPLVALWYHQPNGPGGFLLPMVLVLPLLPAVPAAVGHGLALRPEPNRYYGWEPRGAG